MKKQISAAVAFAAAAACAGAVNAQDISVTVNGAPVEFDQPPVIQNDRTLVPMRAIFEALGASVDWDDSTKTVSSVKGDTEISVTIGSEEMTVGGEVKTLDVPAQIISDRTMVPVRAISEAFSCTVDWDGANQQVIITTPDETAAASGTAEQGGSAGASGVSGTAAKPVVEIKDNVNIYDPDVAIGAIDPATGEQIINEETAVTDYVPVQGGKTYFAAVYHPNAKKYVSYCKDYAFYDANKSFISGGSDDMSKLVKAPANAAYIRYTITIRATGVYTSYVCFMQTDKAPEAFEKSALVTANATTSDFVDKTVYFVGDTQINKGEEWLVMVDRTLNPQLLMTKGQDGLHFSTKTGISFLSDSFTAQLDKTADYVVINTGSYDWMNNFPYDEEEGTRNYTEAVKEYMKGVKDIFPNSKVFIMTPPTAKYVGGGFTENGQKNTAGATLAQYTDVVRTEAKNNSLNLIDVASLWDTDEVSKYMKETEGENYLYPNREGSKLISDMIVKELIANK